MSKNTVLFRNAFASLTDSCLPKYSVSVWAAKSKVTTVVYLHLGDVVVGVKLHLPCSCSCKSETPAMKELLTTLTGYVNPLVTVKGGSDTEILMLKYTCSC